MKKEKTIKPIAHIHTEFPTKFGLPRQSSLKNELRGVIVFEPEYRRDEALRELDGFSHLWLIWHFTESDSEQWRPTVRPPRLGGNRRVGVFASRSPFRPNALGLSCVRLERICRSSEGCDPALCPLGRDKCPTEYGTALLVSGIDMTDSTPIFDIKPYIPVADCHPEASEGYTELTRTHILKVDPGDELPSVLSEEKLAAVIAALEDDPRPGYKHGPENEDRIFRMELCGYDIPFRVCGDRLTVLPGARPICK